MSNAVVCMTNNKVIEILYCASFLVHLCTCFYVANVEPMSWLSDISAYLFSMYESIGFHWSRDTAYLLSYGILFGIVLNAVRRAIEGVLLGWPRFKDHDGDTFHKFWLRCMVGVVFVFLVFGAWGANHSKNFARFISLDASYEFGGIMNVFSVALFSFLLGSVVNIIDDAISATVSILRKCK